MTRRPPCSTLFPCTTLFRSLWRRVLAMPAASAAERAHAALGLTRPDCIDPGVGALLRASVHEDRRSMRSEEHTSELQSHVNLVCRLLLEKKKYLAPNYPSCF